MAKLNNVAAFFAAVRGSLFSNQMNQLQVKGCASILSASSGLAIAEVAYAMATAYHETGRTIAPNREDLNYTASALLALYPKRISADHAWAYGRTRTQNANQEAIADCIYGGDWGIQNLGNTEPRDGYLFRGGGMDHVTGRRNYALVDRDLKLGGKLLKFPNLILDADIAARAMITGMQTGRYTGRKISLPGGCVPEAAFVPCRRIINGLDRADDIAGYAMKFQDGLHAGGWA